MSAVANRICKKMQSKAMWANLWQVLLKHEASDVLGKIEGVHQRRDNSVNLDLLSEVKYQTARCQMLSASPAHQTAGG